ncbi:hypothetical protein NSIN_30223 [Nitrosotalea sinensis]|uniref:Uncharacterized protein n=1 Tax=Nitrosotalea sinensis TaxID=1499975 RepID=A0A2H1EIZ7_9ARCH|nr:hypothetical protein NSIN_30223 [Candidatus Nitrosotalea sinensis]
MYSQKKLCNHTVNVAFVAMYLKKNAYQKNASVVLIFICVPDQKNSLL